MQNGTGGYRPHLMSSTRSVSTSVSCTMYVEERDGAVAMNVFFALVVVGGVFLMFAIRSESIYTSSKSSS